MNARAPRKRLLLSGAVMLCLAAGLWWSQRAGKTRPRHFPGGAEVSTSKRLAGERAEVRALVEAWLAEPDAAKEAAGAASIVTITSPYFPGRHAAFRKLLEGLDGENGPALHASLREAATRGRHAALTDAEWEAFLEKRGRLEGAAALQQLSGDPHFPWQVPALLRGWASEDPAAALAWLGEMARAAEPPEWRTAALRELIAGWTLREPAGPASWFAEHQDDPAFEEAVTAYAAGIAAGDPAAAFRWAETVEGRWRAHAIEQAAREWLARDPAAATAALGEAGYDSAEIGKFAEDPEGRDITQGGGSAGLLHLGE